MTLLERVKGLFGVTFGGPGAATYQSARDWALGIETTTNSSLTMPYAQHPSVCIAIRTIAEDAASVAWELYPDSGDPAEDQIEDHPLLDKWDKPSETMSGTYGSGRTRSSNSPGSASGTTPASASARPTVSGRTGAAPERSPCSIRRR
jgi:hypothetical protein